LLEDLLEQEKREQEKQHQVGDHVPEMDVQSTGLSSMSPINQIPGSQMAALPTMSTMPSIPSMSPMPASGKQNFIILFSVPVNECFLH